MHSSFAMETIGTQVKLPFRRAYQIAVQGIRIRLGRSLVTVCGVVLGVAFLVSNITGQLIKTALVHEREQRLSVNLMESVIRSEVGSLAGKSVAVAVCGTLTPVESALLERLKRGSSASIRTALFSDTPVTPLAWQGDGNTAAAVLLVLGDDGRCPVALAELAAGLSQKVVIDSKSDRVYPDGIPAGIRRELFFGQESESHLKKLRQSGDQNRARTLWVLVVSLLVTGIGVANALLMSVTERFREIGTMKCLGAVSGFVRRLFLIESALIGIVGSVMGALLGVLLPMVAYGISFGFRLVFGMTPYGELVGVVLAGVAAGTVMAMLAAIYPANMAARMVPSAALRSNV